MISGIKLNLIHSKSIFVQLAVFSLLISLIPLVTISTFMYRKMDIMIEEEMEDYHGQVASQYIKNIEEKLNQYQTSLNYISNNTIILNTLTVEEDNPYTRGNTISEEIDKSLFLEKESEIRNCMVYSMMEETPAYGSSVTMLKEASHEVWYLKERVEMEEWFSYFVFKDSQPVLSLVKNMEKLDTENLKSNQLGLVKLDLDMKKLFAPAALDSQDGAAAYNVIVYGDNAQIFYTTDREKNEVLVEYLDRVYGEKEDDSLVEIKPYMVLPVSLKKYNLNMLLIFNNGELLKRKAEMKSMVLPLIGLVVLLVIGGVYLYSLDFSSRVALLVKKIRKAEKGDLTIVDPIGGKDEIAVLDHQFNQMLQKLDQLIKTNYIQKLENKETQLRNLQLQINPHFLYNTLETISSIAAVKQVFVVCDMCNKLGEIFRYSLGKDYGEFVTLEQEMTHIQNYIFIQKIRYGERLEVRYDIEEDCRMYKILRFVLQPIVENAIIHGLGSVAGKGVLEIAAFKQEEKLMVRISDDGVGMDEQKVEELVKYINSDAKTEDNKKSIGIKNVNQRIKFSCGEEYGVAIESRLYQGSCFSLHLPLIEGENTDET